MVFIDESGDHSLTSIDVQYPLFVLTFCIIHKTEYARQIIPSFTDFKMEFFGHDLTVLHSHEIRKPRGDFSILLNPNVREHFMQRLGALIGGTPMTIVAIIIRKQALKARYATPQNPYDLALRFGLERVFSFLWANGQKDRVVPLIAESRGRKEDADLELQFRRITQNVHSWGLHFMLSIRDIGFELRFAVKQTNSIGMQLADLVAHPIGRKILKPEQPNRAYEQFESKLLRNDKGLVQGWGLKVFP
jgi:hypothetical protein